MLKAVSSAHTNNLMTQYLFQPIAVQSLGLMHESSWQFLVTLVTRSQIGQATTATAHYLCYIVTTTNNVNNNEVEIYRVLFKDCY